MAKAPAPGKEAAREAIERDAALARDWIAQSSPFERVRRGVRHCLYCGAPEPGATAKARGHDADCLWREATSLGKAARGAALQALARRFAAAGPWERPAPDGQRQCIVCGLASPSHAETCAYWRSQLRALLAGD